MQLFKCKMCGGTLEIQPEATVAVCDSCGTKQTLPTLSDDKKANLFDRANHFRRANEYDKAMAIFEQILAEDATDAEVYWSLVLCRYGVEYVEDPATRKRIPTCNRTQFTSVLADADYKKTLELADDGARLLYEEEAQKIADIQKGILAISQKEEPFDVFICYKETDDSGRRTPDSVLAQDLYYQLTNEGFKVFFSRITLENKLGTAYEPYIFAALNSAKVMIVLGTRPEYFNAVWVKNEWSRYLAIIKQDSGKMLIPAYKDMDPYNLPEEFSYLQSQDMSKLGFMQDLIRGIQKIVTPNQAQPAAVSQNANVDTLLKRIYLFLEDGDWENAESYAMRVLDTEPTNAKAYLYQLMAEQHLKTERDLQTVNRPLNQFKLFNRALAFSDGADKARLEQYLESSFNNYCDSLLTKMQSKSSEEAFQKNYQAFQQAPDCAKKQQWLEKLTQERELIQAQRQAASDKFQEVSEQIIKAKENAAYSLSQLFVIGKPSLSKIAGLILLAAAALFFMLSASVSGSGISAIFFIGFLFATTVYAIYYFKHTKPSIDYDGIIEYFHDAVDNALSVLDDEEQQLYLSTAAPGEVVSLPGGNPDTVFYWQVLPHDRDAASISLLMTTPLKRHCISDTSTQSIPWTKTPLRNWLTQQMKGLFSAEILPFVRGIDLLTVQQYQTLAEEQFDLVRPLSFWLRPNDETTRSNTYPVVIGNTVHENYYAAEYSVLPVITIDRQKLKTALKEKEQQKFIQSMH